MKNKEQIKPWTHTSYQVQHTSWATNALLYFLIREILIKVTFVYVMIILRYLLYKTQLQVLHKNVIVNKTNILGFYQVVSSWWKEYRHRKAQMPIFPQQEIVQILQHQCVYIYVTFLSVIIGHSKWVREGERETRGTPGVVGIRKYAYVKCNHWRNTN